MKSFSDMSEFELSSKYLHSSDSDKRKIEEYIYKKYYDKLRALVFYITHFKDRDDMLQEAYIVLIKSMQSFQPHKVKEPSTYSIWVRWKEYIKASNIDSWRRETTRIRSMHKYLMGEKAKGHDYSKDCDIRDTAFMDNTIDSCMIEDFKKSKYSRKKDHALIDMYLRYQNFQKIAKDLNMTRAGVSGRFKIITRGLAMYQREV